ncbi:protein FAR1-RELATED SEQUENCE 5 isoform X2 [Brachypodium distachyon]|uniref:SWIM-type domain-containing protein n=1 Tax=Brachypodium distachyon TaxID=15368 RepID=A0A0Q3K7S7_BRADI|nr:protein FAR1-RELATED SEQUENCE 5 isoform X2 [Brachypodium distachyon]XP_024314050.1 protein FAR1-RELATED SEQUENCE 5 isoform X2 [Brachypodium distachyon]XP_024314051.1 protein FAR1-RELATED SEQUENCE 5 isoform X2 [Brachypodium distachyon]KQK06905.1 hypothetical protein BRADI_2g31180v3 [Brachypodium distachyon]PNT71554.1 hypothetical protein BRADI_2g31180v3 [Brachypodium distachyon]|eukprot:XP_024314049.1 protein FAR1-RELATED SEQUENCE 5 isoform X2 [Brachypodium distachyon]
MPGGMNTMGRSAPTINVGASTLPPEPMLHRSTEERADGGENNEDNDDDADDGISPPKKPEVNMRFDSIEAAQQHYVNYARWNGFGIRIDYQRPTKSGETSRTQFVCYKVGKNKKAKEDTQRPESVVPKRKRGITEITGCRARMKIKLDGAAYIVEKFEEEHNHPVIKKFDLCKYLRSHRHIPREERQFVKLLHECNLRTSQMMQLLSHLHGTLNDLTYTRTDMANFKAALRREHTVMDMQHKLRYFEQLKKEDGDFFYSFEMDDEDKVINLYWVDGEARRSYKYYSDCISFDTTYLTNKCNMPCAPFIGINNHGQSVQFGCGFLRNEDTLSFVWLFKTFLEAMDGIAPVNIITDQDFAMRNGISEVFLDATHRNCRWHIMKKAQEKLGGFMGRNLELRADFEDCIDNSFTPEEFEWKWNAMIEKYQVHDNEDLAALWENRTSWVPAYFMMNFYPFLQSTQRSEGFNAVLKRYVSPSNSIFDFAWQYTVLQQKILGVERQAEAETALTVPKKWGFSTLEEQVKLIYTRRMFNRFQEKLQLTSSYHCQRTGATMYEAVSMTGHSGQQDIPWLAADIATCMYSCECCKFDRDGIVCCHILRVMQHEGVRVLPQHYILKRWTWNADVALGPHGTQQLNTAQQEMPEDSRKLMRYATMNKGLSDIAKDACYGQDVTKIVERHMKAMRSELAALKKREEKDARAREAMGMSRRQGLLPEGSTSGARPEGSVSAAAQQGSTSEAAPVGSATGTATEGSAAGAREEGRGNTMEDATPSENVTQEVSAASNGVGIRDPPMTATKGRPRERRYKSPLDIEPKAPKKRGRCKICRSAEHDARTCPQKMANRATCT